MVKPVDPWPQPFGIIPCKCQNVEIGSYNNQVTLRMPAHMITYRTKKQKQGGCTTVGESICVDSCLSNEVQWLWTLGITTTGCCCAHNKVQNNGQDIYPYIGVTADCSARMLELGYKLYPESDAPEHHFVPLCLTDWGYE